MESQESHQVSWHISDKLAFHIFSLVQKSTDLYLEGDIGTWYLTLTALRDMINCELSPEQRTECDAYEKKANEFHKFWKMYKKRVVDGESTTGFTEKKSYFTVITRNYQARLMDLLKEYGWFPNKIDRTVMGF